MTNPTGIVTAVAIIETGILGVAAFHASCLSCGWRCHRQPHPAEATAIRCAERHACKELKP